MKDQRKIKLIVAGGGTGGHVLPGIAIADEWKVQHPKSEILFVGAKNKIEERLVPRAGYSLAVLNLGSLNRVSFLVRLRTCFQLPVTLVESLRILIQFQPTHVIGVGGYSSGPLVLVTCILNFFKRTRIRTAILETNSIAGFTNRILGRFTDFIFLSFPETKSAFGGGSKRQEIYHTGNPIRSVLKHMLPARRDPFYLFIFGGSQGALGMNSVVLKALPELKIALPHLQIVHQTGKIDFERVKKTYEELKFPAQVVEFIDHMPEYYQKSSLVLCRAGSSTLSELAAVKRASILIPLPTAADDHQRKNAEIMEKKGASIFFDQNRPAFELAQMILHLMAHPEKIEMMEEKVALFYTPRAAVSLVEYFSGTRIPLTLPE